MPASRVGEWKWALDHLRIQVSSSRSHKNVMPPNKSHQSCNGARDDKNHTRINAPTHFLCSRQKLKTIQQNSVQNAKHCPNKMTPSNVVFPRV
ncbi:Uncharacterized protein TCM_020179 [Theobroma cacao]|uniref:Uncharacterized protein n=1 Tax=Theobroma cacao TaxID=3641 RepID=A0A061ERZ5_THECC|nr:Uncharacterized protein TCM_020179 [Theobroma cacao]